MHLGSVRFFGFLLVLFVVGSACAGSGFAESSPPVPPGIPAGSGFDFMIDENPIGYIPYVPGIFDCDNFSQAFMIYCLAQHDLIPGQDCWQIKLTPKVCISTVLGQICYDWFGTDTRYLGHAMNIIKIENTQCGTNRYCLVEPQQEHNPIQQCWEQPIGEPISIPSDFSIPGFPSSTYNYTLSATCDSLDPNEGTLPPWAQGPGWCYRFEELTGLSPFEFYEQQCVLEYSGCGQP